MCHYYWYTTPGQGTLYKSTPSRVDANEKGGNGHSSSSVVPGFTLAAGDQSAVVAHPGGEALDPATLSRRALGKRSPEPVTQGHGVQGFIYRQMLQVEGDAVSHTTRAARRAWVLAGYTTATGRPCPSVRCHGTAIGLPTPDLLVGCPGARLPRLCGHISFCCLSFARWSDQPGLVLLATKTPPSSGVCSAQRLGEAASAARRYQYSAIRAALTPLTAHGSSLCQWSSTA